MRQIEKWVEVNAPIAEVFVRFSNLQVFPQWMSGVTSVRLFARQRTHWTGHTADGEAIEWLAETTALDAPHHLAWQTVRGPALSVAADFETTRRGTTLVRVLVNYDEDEAAQLWPQQPDAQWEEDLAHFKSLFEEEAQITPEPPVVATTPASPAWTETAASADGPTLVRARPLTTAPALAEARADRATAPLPRLGETPLATSAALRDESVDERLHTHAPGPLAERATEPTPEVTDEEAEADRGMSTVEQPSALWPTETHRPAVEQPINKWPAETHRPPVAVRGDEARRRTAHSVLAAQTATNSPARRRPLVAYLLLAALLVLALATWRFFALTPKPDSRVTGGTTPTAAPDASNDNEASTPSRPTTRGGAVPSAPSSHATPDTNESVAARPAPSVTPHAETPTSRSAPTNEEASVRAALDDWIAATNSGDLSRLMGHYANVAQRYYQRAGVSRDFIRADKQRLLDAADGFQASVVGEPEITWQESGRVAQVRFRKQYEVTRNGRAQRGEVLQELYLSQGDRGWKIFSERDLRVLRRAALERDGQEVGRSLSLAAAFVPSIQPKVNSRQAGFPRKQIEPQNSSFKSRLASGFRTFNRSIKRVFGGREARRN